MSCTSCIPNIVNKYCTVPSSCKASDPKYIYLSISIRIKGVEIEFGEHTCVKLAHSSMSLSLNKFFNLVLATILRLGFKKNYESYYRSERLQVWTILNNLIYIEPFFLSIYLGLSWPISVYLGSAGLTYFYLLRSILGCIELSKAILEKNWISRDISGYLVLSRALSWDVVEIIPSLFWKSILKSLIKKL